MTLSSEASTLDRLCEFGSATIHEALNGSGAMHSAIKPLDPYTRLAGSALTVSSAPADNLAIQYAVSIAHAGDILVVDAKSYAEAGAWGDLMTMWAQQVGLAGLVIDGSVRDSRQIVAMGFPVFSRGVCIKGTQKNQFGRVNVPIICAGTTVNPGDIVVGDADGIVVVPAAEVNRAVELSQARTDKEAALREQLRNGGSLLDLMGLRDRLTALGYEPLPLEDGGP